jgi:hypothetical protein
MNWQEQCIELWGERWKSTLALTAGVAKRTVQRWNSGESEIKQGVKDKIAITYKTWLKG